MDESADYGFCPFMTAANISKGNADPVACSDRCQLFRPMADEQGNIIGGGCALAVLATVMGSHSVSVSKILGGLTAGVPGSKPLKG